ncbi:MAG: MFS transporter [Chloroflexi bacterium]|nr:MFS transporter [Chloroflexota bacterium]
MLGPDSAAAGPGTRNQKPETRNQRLYYGWVIVAVAALVSLSEVAIFNPVLSLFIPPMSGELGWSRTAISLGATIAAFASGLAGPIFGPIIDRWGPRVLYTAGSIITSLSLLALAFVSSLWQFYLLFLPGRLFSQWATNAGNPVTVANWFIRQRGRAIGITTLGTRAGMALVPPAVQWVMDRVGWRATWQWLGVFTLVTAVLPSALLLRRRPEEMGLAPDGARLEDLARQTASAGPTADHQDPFEVSWRPSEAIRTTAFWLVLAVQCQSYLVGGALNLHHIPHYVAQGLAASEAVLALIAFAVMSGVGGVLFAVAAERLGVRATLSIALLIGGLSLFVMRQVETLPLAFVASSLYGFGFGGMRSLGNLVWSDYFGRRSGGAIRGVTFPVEMASNSLGPLSGGIVFDLTGSYQAALLAYGLLGVSASLLMLTARPPRRPPARLAVSD